MRLFLLENVAGVLGHLFVAVHAGEVGQHGLDDELEIFLKQNVVNPLALAKARKVCLDEDIDTVELLADLRDDNELKNIFTKGTALRIRKGLSG